MWRNSMPTVWSGNRMLSYLSQDDIDEVGQLFHAVFSAPPWCDQWESLNQVGAYMGDLMGNRNSCSFGYRIDGTLIAISLGYIFNWWQGKEYFIKEFCVTREWQRKGVGRCFMSELQSSLALAGVRAIWLSTERSMPAWDFYHSCGFAEAKDSGFLIKSW
jgi:aminoglycoside 6'-N-acetyltransferase I